MSLYGDIHPKFHVTSSFAFDEDFSTAAEITEADGSVLKSVNGMSAVEYLKKLGMLTEDNAVAGSGIWAVPAILKYSNGIKIARAFLGILEGTEYIFASGTIEEGAKIMFGNLSSEKTLASAEKLIEELTQSKENDVLAYSCAARAWSLVKFSAEAQKIAECAVLYEEKNNAPFNYSVTFSGGEICPIYASPGKYTNYLHNYTLIVCSFYTLS